jgi:hypothetical protein
MTDLCPSCREPVDHPSGDGCAAMTKHQPHQCPSPEAIVRAALESAADRVVTRVEKRGPADYRCGISGYSNGIDACFDAIRALASNPAEVAAIIKKAGEDRG